MIDEHKATTVLEYAANFIDSDKRRGVFIRAFVEGEDWAIRDFAKWKADNRPSQGIYGLTPKLAHEVAMRAFAPKTAK